MGLFVPFGVAGIWAAQGRASRRPSAVWTLLTGSLLAFAIQVGQIYMPDRSAALADVLWNVLGIVIGVAAGVSLRHVMTPRGGHVEVAVSSALALLSLWVVAELAPFVPRLDVDVNGSLKALFLNPRFDLPTMIYAAARVLLAGRLVFAVSGSRRAVAAGIASVVSVLAAKLFIEGQALDFNTVAGFAIGLVAWIAWSTSGAPMSAKTLAIILAAAYTLQALAPFSLRESPSGFSVIPFATVLEGSMLVNLRALATMAFVAGGCAWLTREAGGNVLGLSAALAGWFLLLEFAQTFITGRTAGITEPLVAMAAGVLLHYAKDPAGTPAVPAADPDHPLWGERASPSRAVLVDLAVPAAAVMAAVTTAVVTIGLVLRLRSIPYNVAELFVDGGSPGARAYFALMLIWIGAGAVAASHAIAWSRYPYLLFLAAAVLVSLISKLFLDLSVTYESMSDILGSTDLFVQVTQQNYWGDVGRRIFVALSAPDLVDFLERRVRYVALYSPPVMCMAMALLPLAHRTQRRKTPRLVDLVLVGTVMLGWFWLCHHIVLPWGSTDNLQELVAPSGGFRYGGAPYLYALVALMAINVAVIVGSIERIGWLPVAMVFSIVAVPAGWALLGLGLERQVEKYGLTYSAAQFLLGSGRRGGLSDEALAARWAVVQIGIVSVAAFGAWVAHRFAAILVGQRASADPR